MKLESVLINGSWTETCSSRGVIFAVDPTTGKPLEGRYPVSSYAEAERALLAGKKAAAELRRIPAERIADFLDLYAARIEARREEIVRMASLETALPAEPRLRSVEMPRTLNQLRQAANAVRDRSWRHAVIDTRAGIRSMHNPLGGTVLVFAPNNFPLAMNAAAGNDSTAALAAGNPVLAVSNPGHPGTTKLLAEMAREAIQEAALPPAAVQLLFHLRPEDGFRLLAHPALAAAAFTGSRASGLKLKKAADEAGKPIFLEMASLNPVLALPCSLEKRSGDIARELFASCTLGNGQFCTKPGLTIVLQSPEAEEFLQTVAAHFQEASPGYLLSEGVLKKIAATVGDLVRRGAELVTGGKKVEGPGFRFENTLLRVSGDIFLANPRDLQEEAFGPVSLMVFVRDESQLVDVLEALEGNLTGCVYSDIEGGDDILYNWIEPVLRRKTGRLLNDKMPTGVAVSPAMAHGGPFPATGHPAFTSIGIPASFLRFTALQCYDNVREDRLPPELKDKNPTGRMWRLIDGEWTQRNVG